VPSQFGSPLNPIRSFSIRIFTYTSKRTLRRIPGAITDKKKFGASRTLMKFSHQKKGTVHTTTARAAVFWIWMVSDMEAGVSNGCEAPHQVRPNGVGVPEASPPDI
jgi:hypothetical protein